jgi:Fe-S oxidoreductase
MLLGEAVMDLIETAVAGENFVELNEADVCCCGSAGSYNLTEPKMAARLQQRKIKNILATGAEIVVTTNPNLLTNLPARHAAPSEGDRKQSFRGK